MNSRFCKFLYVRGGKAMEKSNNKGIFNKTSVNYLFWIVLALLGVLLIITAATGIYAWWKQKSKAPEAIARLFGCAAFCVLGIWILFNAGTFINIINIVLGAVLIVTSVLSLLRAWRIQSTLAVILSAIGIVLGVIIASYNAATTLPVVYEGIALIYAAVTGFIGEWQKK